MKTMSFSAAQCRHDGVDVVQAKDLSPETFKEQYWEQNKPVLIKGAMKDWPAFSLWRKPGYLVSKTMNPEVGVCKIPINEATGDRSQSSQARLSEVFKALQDGSSEPLWIHAWPFLRHVKTAADRKKLAMFGAFGQRMTQLVQQDFLSFDFLPETKPALIFPEWRIFIYRNSFTDWHPHPADTHLMCQLYGDKEVFILPPNEGREIIKPIYDNKVNSFAADSQTMAKIQNCNPIRVLVEEGDAFHIPVYWYHMVKPTDPTRFGITLAHAFRAPIRINGDFRFHQSRDLYNDSPAKLKLALSFARLVALFQRHKPLLVD